MPRKNVPIIDEEQCNKGISYNNNFTICGEYSSSFKIYKTVNSNSFTVYEGVVEKEVIKKEQPVTRTILYPFALAFDIVMSPVYLIGGTIIMIIVGMHEGPH